MGLDTLGLLFGWEEAFGIQIEDHEAFDLTTPQSAIDLICQKVAASDSEVGVCPTVRAFYRIRRAFSEVLNLPPEQVRLDSKWRQFLPKPRREGWNAIAQHVDLPSFPPLKLGVGTLFLPITIYDLVDWAVAHHACELLSAEERWTCTQVRSIVRSVVRDVVGVRKFEDTQPFIDLGIS